MMIKVSGPEKPKSELVKGIIIIKQGTNYLAISDLVISVRVHNGTLKDKNEVSLISCSMLSFRFRSRIDLWNTAALYQYISGMKA